MCEFMLVGVLILGFMIICVLESIEGPKREARVSQIVYAAALRSTDPDICACPVPCRGTLCRKGR